MPLRIRCSRCTKALSAPDELLGRNVKCPHCGQVLQLPQAGSARAPQMRVPTVRERKICTVCGQDCSGGDRVKDRHGRYYHRACYERATGREVSARHQGAPPVHPPPSTHVADGAVDPNARAPSLKEADDGYGVTGMAAPEGSTACPSCGQSLQPGAVLCTACGYDFRTGRQHDTAAPPGPATDGAAPRRDTTWWTESSTTGWRIGSILLKINVGLLWIGGIAAMAGGGAGGGAAVGVFIVLAIVTAILLALARGLANESGGAKGVILVFAGLAVLGAATTAADPRRQGNSAAMLATIGMVIVWVAWFVLTSRRGTRLTAAIGTTLYIVGNIMGVVAEVVKG